MSKKMIKTDKVVYRTRTREEYDWLMEKLEEDGFEWSSGNLPTAPEVADNWIEYLSETCIDFDGERIVFANFDFYKNKSSYSDYEFIEVSDLMEKDVTTENIDELEAIYKQVSDQIEDLRKQGKEPKAIEYTIKVCFE